jgi:hypothetical protein
MTGASSLSFRAQGQGIPIGQTSGITQGLHGGAPDPWKDVTFTPEEAAFLGAKPKRNYLGSDTAAAKDILDMVTKRQIERQAQLEANQTPPMVQQAGPGMRDGGIARRRYAGGGMISALGSMPGPVIQTQPAIGGATGASTGMQPPIPLGGVATQQSALSPAVQTAGPPAAPVGLPSVASAPIGGAAPSAAPFQQGNLDPAAYMDVAQAPIASPITGGPVNQAAQVATDMGAAVTPIGANAPMQSALTGPAAQRMGRRRRGAMSRQPTIAAPAQVAMADGGLMSSLFTPGYLKDPKLFGGAKTGTGGVGKTPGGFGMADGGLLEAAAQAGGARGLPGTPSAEAPLGTGLDPMSPEAAKAVAMTGFPAMINGKPFGAADILEHGRQFEGAGSHTSGAMGGASSGGGGGGAMSGMQSDHGMQGQMADGGGLISGPGDGRSDSIPVAMPDGPGAVADGEYIVPAWAVSAAGGGSTKAGAKKLDAMVGDLKQSWPKQVSAFGKPKAGGKPMKRNGGAFAEGGKIPGYVQRSQKNIYRRMEQQQDRRPYEDDVAKFNADQARAFEQARGVASNDSTGYFGAVQGGQDLLSGVFDGDGSNRAYDDELVQASLDDFDRGTSMAAAEADRKAAGRGAFGSRRDLAESETSLQANKNRALLGSQLREQGLERRTAAAGQIANLAGQERQAAIGNVALLTGVGNQQQEHDQAVLDAPMNRLARQSALVSGTPVGAGAAGGPSKAQGALAGAMTGASAGAMTGNPYAIAGGAAIGAGVGYFGSKDGGMVKRRGGRRNRRKSAFANGGKVTKTDDDSPEDLSRYDSVQLDDDLSRYDDVQLDEQPTEPAPKDSGRRGMPDFHKVLKKAKEEGSAYANGGLYTGGKNTGSTTMPRDKRRSAVSSGGGTLREVARPPTVPGDLPSFGEWWNGEDPGIGIPGQEERSAMHSPPMLNPAVPDEVAPDLGVTTGAAPGTVAWKPPLPVSKPAHSALASRVARGKASALTKADMLVSSENDSPPKEAVSGGPDAFAKLASALTGSGKTDDSPAPIAVGEEDTAGATGGYSWASPLMAAGLSLLASNDGRRKLSQNLGLAGMAGMQEYQRGKAEDRQDARLKNEDSRLELAAQRQQKLDEAAERRANLDVVKTTAALDKATRDGARADKLLELKMDQVRATDAYRSARLKQIDSRNAIAQENANTQRASMEKRGAKSKAAADPNKTLIQEYQKQIVKAETDGDSETADRLRKQLAGVMAQGGGGGGGGAADDEDDGGDLTAPDGFELDE